MELSIQERLKDLRVERGLTLEQLEEQTHHFHALGNVVEWKYIKCLFIVVEVKNEK